MEAATSPAELELSGPDWSAFKTMMEDTTADSDLVRIDWLLERVAGLHAQIAENNEIADRRIAMQEDFRQGENGKLDRAITYWVGQIGQLAPPSGEAMKSEYGQKSRELAHGKFGFKARPERIEIDDEKAALAFAVKNHLPVRIVNSVTKTSLKDHAAATGECEGDGWRRIEAADEFFVKT